MERKSTIHHHANGSKRAHVADAASDLLNEGKKLAQELCEEGLERVNDVGQEAKEISDALLQRVKDKPLTSVLIAAGVGFLLSMFIKK